LPVAPILQTLQLKLFAKKSKNITYLNVSGCFKLTDDSITHISSLVHLTTLCISNCGKISNVCPLSNCVKLKALYLDGLQSIILYELLPVLQHCKTLTHLSFVQWSYFNQFGISQLFDHSSPHLHYFDLTDCKRMTDKAILILVQICNELEYLSLSGCELISDSGIHAVAIQCPRIKTLLLTGCELLTDISMQNIENNCLFLRMLNVSGCTKITQPAVNNIRFARGKGVIIIDPIFDWSKQ